MPINYSHPVSDASLFADQMKTTKAQLANVQRQLDAAYAERDAQPYSWDWRQKLPALIQLKGRLESQLRGQEISFRSVGGGGDPGPRALSGGSYWLPADS